MRGKLTGPERERGKTLPRKRLSRRLVISFILIALLPLAIFGVMATQSNYRYVKEHVAHDHFIMATLAMQRIDQFLGDVRRMVLGRPGIAQSLETGDLQGLKDKLAVNYKDLGVFDAIFVLDAQGNCIWREPYGHQIGEFFSHLQFFKDAMEKGKPVISDVYVWTAAEKPLITAAAPLRDSKGEIIGVFGGDISPEVIWNMISQVSSGSRSYAYVVDGHGRTIAHPQKDYVSKMKDLSQVPAVAQILARKEGAGVFDDPLEGGQWMTAHVPSSESNWGLVLQMPAEEAFAPAVDLVRKAVALSLLALIVTVGVAIYQSKRITEPIKQLYQGAQAIGEGNYEHRITVKTGDELESLADAFNYMSRRLKENIGKLRKSEREIRGAREKLLQRVAQLEALREIDQAITSTLDLDMVLRLVAEKTLERVGARRCVLLMVDEQTQHVVGKLGIGFTDEEIKRIRLKVGEGVSGLVAQRGEPALVEDATSDPRVSQKYLHDLHSTSFISVPLKVKEKVIGVFDVVDKKEGKFTNDDVDSLSLLATQAAIAIENARLYQEIRHKAEELEKSYKEIEDDFMSTIHTLASLIEMRDKYTGEHSRHLGRAARSVAQKLNLPPQEIRDIEIAAGLHDIGKIGIAENILNKPGVLSPEEFQEVKNHSMLGTRAIEGIKKLENVARIIKHHHENYDGSGYPDGLKEKEIPVGSRINLIADAYYAMISDRPYRKAFSKKRAVSELMRGKGTQFDPQIVDIFLEYLRETEEQPEP